MLYTNEALGHFAKDPCVVQYNGKWWLYHSVMLDRVLGIGIAVSDDGDHFSYCGTIPLTCSCEKNGIGAPGAIVHDGRIHLFYQTYGNGAMDAICHAISEDGLHFIKDANNPIFAPRPPFTEMPEWSCGRAIDADVCIFGSRLYLYFATRDRNFRRQIVGCATAPVTPDLSSGWELYPEPVLTPTLDWERDCIEAPAAICRDGKIYLFYAGSYNCAPQQIGCAVSEDGVHFQRLFTEKPFLCCGDTGDWNASESGHPYILEAVDGQIWLYYQGSPDNGKSWYLSRHALTFSDGLPQFLP